MHGTVLAPVLFVGEGPPCDLQDIQGHTPLHIACRNAHHGADYLPTIRLLLQLGAAPDIPSNPTDEELAELPMFAAGRLPVDCVTETLRAEVSEVLSTTKKDDKLLELLKLKYEDLVISTEPIPPSMTIGPPVTSSVPSSKPKEKQLSKPLDLKNLPKDSLMFVGQGTQFVGMAKDLLDRNGAGKALFARASAILGYDLAQLCLEGPADKLTSTAYSQPAVMVSSLAALAELKERHPALMQEVGHVAGFSLGEITALVAAELISFEDGLKLVKLRAEAMQVASEQHPGGMGSITGLKDDVLAEVVKEAQAETGGVLAVANYLFEKGRVVSGDHAAVELACKKASAKGAISAKKLPVGGAFHTSHMALAKDAIAKALNSIEIKAPTRALYSNVSGKPYTSVEEIRELLIQQAVSPVQWEAIAQALAGAGGKIYEVGAGEQLKAMMRRINAEAWKRVENVGHWMPPKN
eukprot:EG_transcript_8716